MTAAPTYVFTDYRTAWFIPGNGLPTINHETGTYITDQTELNNLVAAANANGVGLAFSDSGESLPPLSQGPQGPTGPPGPPGPASTLSPGTVSSGNLAMSITGVAPNLLLNLTIPPGAPGTNGTNGVNAYPIFVAPVGATNPTTLSEGTLLFEYVP